MPSPTAIFEKIEPRSTADAVVEQIENLILTGVYRPGDRLPAERDLAERLNVSRPTLRAAVQSLERRKLLYARHGGGTYVADIHGSMFQEPIVELFRHNRRAAEDCIEFRREIEGVAAQLAAERATDADKEILIDLLGQMEVAHERAEFDEEARIDLEFHQAISEATHNVVLLHTMRSCYELLANGIFHNRLQLYQIAGARENLLAQHRNICGSILAGDAAQAKAAAAAHMNYVAKQLHDAQRSSDRAETALRRRGRMQATGGRK